MQEQHQVLGHLRWRLRQQGPVVLCDDTTPYEVSGSSCLYSKPRDSQCLSGGLALAATATAQSFTDVQDPSYVKGDDDDNGMRDTAKSRQNYHRNVSCSWTITAPAGSNVRLRLDDGGGLRLRARV